MLHTQFRGPSPSLEPFVRFYTQREVNIRGAAVVHPVPARACPMIEFGFCDPMDVIDYKQRMRRTSPNAVVVGPQTYRRVDMHLQGSLHSFVIMFKADGIHRLFSIPMDEMTDRDHDAHSVLGSFVSQARQSLGECKSFAERVSLVEKLFLQRSLRATDVDGISAAANRILLTGGRVAIPTLAGLAELSLRHFERRFIRQVGVRPKLFARIARFEAALERKARFVSQSWTDVAHEFGYYDQMHMVHDFAEFTGGTPSEALAQLEMVFVEQIRSVRAGRGTAADQNDSRLIL